MNSYRLLLVCQAALAVDFIAFSCFLEFYPCRFESVAS